MQAFFELYLHCRSGFGVLFTFSSRSLDINQACSYSVLSYAQQLQLRLKTIELLLQSRQSEINNGDDDFLDEGAAKNKEVNTRVCFAKNDKQNAAQSNAHPKHQVPASHIESKLEPFFKCNGYSGKQNDDTVNIVRNAPLLWFNKEHGNKDSDCEHRVGDLNRPQTSGLEFNH
jgi:hypothetical protein